ncbi:MAG TPA: hypothetical protein VGN35_13660 [Jatrophihabitantaceae bacterium]|jgi:hypothetical protein|nr:hypothetical protein [Jatrophihabitantaceae bacterium]
MQLAATAYTDRGKASRLQRVGTARAVVGTLIAAVAAISLVAGCSSSKSTSSGSSHSSGSTSAGPATGSPADTAAITDAYTKLFAISTPMDTSVGLIQDGEAFRPTLVAQSKTSFAKTASATVAKVTVTSSNRATVIFTILLNKSPVLPNQTGYAVRENGTWKVAGITFCGLLAAQGTPPPVCAQPAATSLPN